MKVKIKKINVVQLFMQFLLLVMTLIILFLKKQLYNKEEFLFICRYGLAAIILAGFFLAWQQKRIVSIINIFFALFCLFQFGIPICFALDPGYLTDHLLNFNYKILINAAYYSVIIIVILSISISICLLTKATNNKFFVNTATLENEKLVKQVAKFLFSATALIVLPLYVYVTYLTLVNGFSQTTRGILSSSNIFNLTRAFFTVQAFYIYVIQIEKVSHIR